MMRTLRWLTPMFVLVCGCDTFFDATGWPRPDNEPNANSNTGPTKPHEVGLKRFESAAEFQEYFTAQVAGTYQGGFRNELPTTGEFDADATAGGEADAAPTPQSEGADGETAVEDFSTTTTQEEGVQEADIIKNDGRYIYVLSEGTLRIVQADPGETLQELPAVDLEGHGRDLYLLENRIVALTRPEVIYDGPVAQEIGPAPVYYRPRVQVTVIDVADRANPLVESTTWFEGDLSSSRMIGDLLHLVLVSNPDFFEPVIAMREGGTAGLEVAEVDVDMVLPDYEVDVADSEPTGGNTVDWANVYYPIDPGGYGMTTVVTLDINDPAAFDSVGVVAYPGEIYASTEALYLTDYAYDFFGEARQMTDVYKFAFTDDGPLLAAVGAVPGRVLNQYSMGEYQGYLRIATTIDPQWSGGGMGSPSTNNVYVLAEQAGDLAIVGRAENLAPGEEIYSARFSGPRGYLVTFEQIDPLFTLDLADPTNPRVVGKLKVPGYSTFIIEMDENHLLTIGRDAPTDGSWVIPQGVQLSIFDISNFADPQLKFDPEYIGEPDAWSEALYNPKALTYFPAQNLLALPVEITNYWWFGFEEMDEEVVSSDTDQTGDDDDDEPLPDDLSPPEEFRGLYVYRVTPEEGFEFLGRMSTAIGDDYYYYNSFTRGVFMNDNVFAVTDLGVVGAPVSDVNSVPWQVSFPYSPPEWDYVGGGDSESGSGGASTETASREAP